MQYTAKCLESIRKVLPKSQIILSTWEGELVDGLLYDVVVFSKDPGDKCMDSDKIYYCNINRQLVGINRGLRFAERKYVLKWRTDILLKSSSFLTYYGKFDKMVYRNLNHRLLITNYYTRNPRIFPLLYHPSDWIMFGVKEDLVNYYDVPVYPGIKTELMKPWKDLEKQIFLYAPELYFFVQFLLKNKEEIFFINNIRRTFNGVLDSERRLAECFCVLDYKKMIDIEFLKYNPNINKDKFSLVNYDI